MNIHEYQAKQVLGAYQVPVPRGHVAFTPEELSRPPKSLAARMGGQSVIHAGGYGKGGGVKVVKCLKKFAKKPPVCWA